MAGNQSAAVVVTTAGGQSDQGPSFTYLPPPAPTVSGLSPASGPVTGTATPITISGTNFIPTSGTQVTVNFGGKTAVGQVLSATSVSCVPPPGLVPGQVDVQVTALGGQSAVSPGDKYTYTP
jgi:hypothetical protein